MATPQQLEAVSAWLKKVLAPYVQASLVHNQVLALLSGTKTLAPRTDHFTYDDGRTQLLLTLRGTVNIKFKGGTYNIPMALWLPFNYPTEDALAFVVPTSNMLIRPSSKVELSGRVSIPSDRNRDLLGIVDLLKQLFENEPPVYAVPQGPPRPGPSTIQPSSYPTPSPIVPPRPDQTITSPTTSPRPTSSHSQSFRPPLPAPPPVPPASPPHSPPARPPLPARPDLAASTYAAPPLNSSTGQSPPVSQSATPALPAPPPTGWSPQPSARPAAAHRETSSLNSISNILDQTDDPLPSLASSAGAGEPSRPVHPDILALRTALLSKLQYADEEVQNKHTESLQHFEAIHQDLLAGNAAIQDELARLKAVHQVVSTVRDRYEEMVQAAQARVKALDEHEEPQVDTIVVCHSTVHTQLLDLLSEDAALEDTIYQLGRSLHSSEDERAGVVDMEKTLKRIRNLAREQFLKRALGNKILLELALANVT